MSRFIPTPAGLCARRHPRPSASPPAVSLRTMEAAAALGRLFANRVRDALDAETPALRAWAIGQLQELVRGVGDTPLRGQEDKQ